MVKLVAIVVICALIITYLKSINSDLFSLACIGAGIVVLSFAFDYVSEAFSFVNSVVELSGIDKEFYKIIFKITAIGYLIEFGADLVLDMGLKGLSEKLVFVGKIVIFCTSLPIFYSVFNLLIGLLE